MKLNALLLKPQDNVVTCIREVHKGEDVVFRRGEEVCALMALEDIPYCHKAPLLIRPIYHRTKLMNPKFLPILSHPHLTVEY